MKSHLPLAVACVATALPTILSFQPAALATSRRTTLWSTWSPSSSNSLPSSSGGGYELFQVDPPFTRIDGSGTVRTYDLPVEADRAEYMLQTFGRPLEAQVELWVGPIRTIHTLDVKNEDGVEFPVRGVLKFEPGTGHTLRITSTAAQEFPLLAAVSVPTPDRSKLFTKAFDTVWDSSIKTFVQGGDVYGNPGAVRTFNIPPDVQSVQVLFWSRDTGKKSLKAKIEVLHGPNNKKQEYDLYCGRGLQPYHAILETPSSGVTLRIYNKKFLEDGLFQVAVVPYKMRNGLLITDGKASIVANEVAKGTQYVNSTPFLKSDWWE